MSMLVSRSPSVRLARTAFVALLLCEAQAQVPQADDSPDRQSSTSSDGLGVTPSGLFAAKEHFAALEATDGEDLGETLKDLRNCAGNTLVLEHDLRTAPGRRGAYIKQVLHRDRAYIEDYKNIKKQKRVKEDGYHIHMKLFVWSALFCIPFLLVALHRKWMRHQLG